MGSQRRAVISKLLLLFFILLFSSITVLADNILLNATRDSYVDENSANTNYGTSNHLELQYDYPTRIIYIQFNLSQLPPGASISSAILNLYKESDDNGGVACSGTSYINHSIYLVTNDSAWLNETNITYNNQPCGPGFNLTSNCNLTPQSTTTIYGLGYNAYKQFNMSNVTISEYEKDKLISIAIKENGRKTCNAMTYSSKEATYEPYLNITYEPDTVYPSIQYVNPTYSTSTYWSRTYIETNVTATDTYLDKIISRLYNSTGLVQTNVSSTSPLFINFTGLSDGVYYINASANDTAGNLNSTETRVITLDTTKPAVQYAPNSVTSGIYNTDQILNYTASDTNYNRTEIYVDIDGALTMYTCYSTSCNRTLSIEGNYTIYAKAYDNAGNSNTSSTINVIIDKTNPVITNIVLSPSKTYYSGLADVYVNATIIEPYVDKVLLNLTYPNMTSILYTMTGISTLYRLNITPYMTQEGTYNFTIIANDTIGNSNISEKHNFTTDLTCPSVTNVMPVANTNYSRYAPINITSTISDNIALSSKIASITYPNGVNYNFSLNNSEGDIYYYLLNLGALVGRYNVTIIANDTAYTGNVNATETTYFNVVNHAPTILDVNISPTLAYVTSVLNCTCAATDSDPYDNVSISYRWYKNGNLTSANSSTYTCNIVACSKFDNFTCEATASDNALNHSYNETKQISNSIPVINNVEILSTTGGIINASTDLNCTYSNTDADGDSVNQTFYVWQKNGEDTTNTSQILNHSYLSSADKWSCSVVIFDGYDNSTKVYSLNVTIDDSTPPTIENDSVNPSSGEEGESFYIYVDVVDDTAVSSVKVEISSSAYAEPLGNFTMSRVSGNRWQKLYTPLNPATYTFKFFAWDTSLLKSELISNLTYVARRSSTGGAGSPSSTEIILVNQTTMPNFIIGDGKCDPGEDSLNSPDCKGLNLDTIFCFVLPGGFKDPKCIWSNSIVPKILVFIFIGTMMLLLLLRLKT